jgi:serine/threonine protein kinase
MINSGRVPSEKVLDIMKQIMRGFLEVVKAKIVHRDLKPSNILLTSDKTIKIADFGFAVFSS